MKEKGYEIEILDNDHLMPVFKYFNSKLRIKFGFGFVKNNKFPDNFFIRNHDFSSGQRWIIQFTKKPFTFRTYEYFWYTFHSVKTKNDLKKYTSKDILNLIRLEKFKKII